MTSETVADVYIKDVTAVATLTRDAQLAPLQTKFPQRWRCPVIAIVYKVAKLGLISVELVQCLTAENAKEINDGLQKAMNHGKNTRKESLKVKGKKENPFAPTTEPGEVRSACPLHDCAGIDPCRACPRPRSGASAPLLCPTCLLRPSLYLLLHVCNQGWAAPRIPILLDCVPGHRRAFYRHTWPCCLLVADPTSIQENPNQSRATCAGSGVGQRAVWSGVACAAEAASWCERTHTPYRGQDDERWCVP